LYLNEVVFFLKHHLPTFVNIFEYVHFSDFSTKLHENREKTREAYKPYSVKIRLA